MPASQLIASIGWWNALIAPGVRGEVSTPKPGTMKVKEDDIPKQKWGAIFRRGMDAGKANKWIVTAFYYIPYISLAMQTQTVWRLNQFWSGVRSIWMCAHSEKAP